MSLTEKPSVLESFTNISFGNFVNYDSLSPSCKAFATALDSVQVPNSTNEALKHPGWRKAVNEKIEALEKNGT